MLLIEFTVLKLMLKQEFYISSYSIRALDYCCLHAKSIFGQYLPKRIKLNGMATSFTFDHGR